MKLSFIFELLLIFILIAFAASAVIGTNSNNLKLRNSRKVLSTVGKHGNRVIVKERQDPASVANKYCSCSSKLCNCCREFKLPVVSMQGPGCASLQYLKGDRLAISMSFGGRVLSNTTVSSKKPQPVCMPLPGGISKFCGKVYNIGRKGDDFNACLGLELRAYQNVEAAVRVSCFRFGSKGLKVEPAQPLPAVENEDDDDDDDDDDDEDEFDFDDDDDDDDDEDEDDDDNDVDTVDYGTFSVFDDDFIDAYFQTESSSSGNKKKTTTTTTTTKRPRTPVRKISTAKPSIINRKPKPSNTVVSTTVTIPTIVTHSTPSITSIPLKTSDGNSNNTTADSVNNTVSMHDQQNVQKEVVPDESNRPSSQNMRPVIPIQNIPMVKEEDDNPIGDTSSESPIPNYIIKSNDPQHQHDDDDDDDDQDPISEVVDGIFSDDDEDDDDNKKSKSKKKLPQKNKKIKNDKDLHNKHNTNDDVVDEIIDDVVDTVGSAEINDSSFIIDDDDDDDDDDHSSGSEKKHKKIVKKTQQASTNKAENNVASEEISQEGSTSNEEDLILTQRNYQQRPAHKRFKFGRHSRDMWLDRLHF